MTFTPVTVSDGTQSYTASNIIVDIDDATSTNNFGNALTEAFLGSGINVTMDTVVMSSSEEVMAEI